MKVLRYLLVSGWVVLLAIVVLCFAVPKPMSHILAPVASLFALPPAILLASIALYLLMRLYKAGMARSVVGGRSRKRREGVRPPQEHPSR
jgi:hypothetical protein